MSVNWLSYWGLKYNPFSPLELSYLKRQDFDAKFIRIQAAKELEQLLMEICRGEIGGAYIIEGAYGSGKSTLLNYAARFLETQMADAKMVPVFVKLTGLANIDNVRKCEEVVRQQMLEGLINAAIRYLPPYTIDTKDIKHARDPLKKFVRLFEEQGYRIAFLIDELDKVDEKIAKLYMSKYQPTGEVLWKNGHVTFWTVHVDWKTHQDPRLSFIHRSILIQRWFQPDIERLLDKRLKAASIDGRLSVYDVFDDSALSRVWSLGGGYPRGAQKVAELSMRCAARWLRGVQKVAESSIRYVARMEKITGETVDLAWLLYTEKYLYEGLLNRLVELLKRDQELNEIYNKITNAIAENPDVTNAIIQLIVEGKVQRKELSEKSAECFDKLVKEGIIRRIGKPGKFVYVPTGKTEQLFSKIYAIIQKEAISYLRMPKRKRRRRGKMVEIELKNWIKNRLKKFFVYAIAYG